MIKEIVKDNKGVEYYLIKANRVNWDVERISDGARLRGNASIFTFDRTVQVEAPIVSPLIRIGATVRVNPKANIWTFKKFTNEYEYDQKFVIIGFGSALGEFKIIEAGGNPRNTYYNIHGKELILA